MRLSKYLFKKTYNSNKRNIIIISFKLQFYINIDSFHNNFRRLLFLRIPKYNFH